MKAKEVIVRVIPNVPGVGVRIVGKAGRQPGDFPILPGWDVIIYGRSLINGRPMVRGVAAAWIGSDLQAYAVVPERDEVLTAWARPRRCMAAECQQEALKRIGAPGASQGGSVPALAIGGGS